MKLNNYDKIAGWYDSLGKLVFLNSQVYAQKDQLSYIPEKSKILIVGGGTGWILEELSKIHLEGLNITFVEISFNMLELARRRKYGTNKVEFIHLPVEEFVSQDRYDVVLTAFLFDNFSKDRINQVFSKLNHLLKSGGLWLFSDFEYEKQQGKKWQGWMLKLMYLFFGKVSNIEAKELMGTGSLFEDKGFIKLKEQRYYKDFIKAVVYQKQSL